MYGFQAIDDSYNISWSTAQAGVATAKKAALKASKKLLVITAGIMELSPTNQDKNKKLGQLLAREAHHTVVLGSMFADEVISGMGNTQKYTRVPHLTAFITETHKQFSTDEWFLLVQSEMHDLYY
jgi:UDP-N-acetylmuramyl pentapeptide synthase